MTSNTAKRRGRPSVYTEALAERICMGIAGGDSLRRICSGPGMPSRRTVLRWLADGEHTAFRHQIARARVIQRDVLADEMREIADDARNDRVPVLDRTGEVIGWRVDTAAIEAARLMIETRRWWAERVAPKRYGRESEALRKTQVTPPSRFWVETLRNPQVTPAAGFRMEERATARRVPTNA